MSDYQKQKQRAIEFQREKEEALKRDLALKAEKEKQIAKDEAERRARMDALAKEARRKELMAANAKLVGSTPDTGAAIEYNPFAEDERRPLPSWANLGNAAGPSKPKARVANGDRRPMTRVPGAGVGGGGGGGGRRNVKRDKSTSPPPLGRKEKAAKAFLQMAKKSSDSAFSVRSLVDSANINAGGDSPQRVPPKFIPIGAGAPTKILKSTPPVTSWKGKAPLGQKKGLVGDLRKLCPDREVRDRRSIDEIQKDIKAKKTPLPLIEKDKDKERETTKRPAAIPSSARPIRPAIPSGNGNGKRARSPSPSSSTSTSSSSSDNSPRRAISRKSPPGPRTRTGTRGRSPSIDPEDISATIRGLFQRPGQVQRRWEEDEDSDDMEAGLSDVEREETRAGKIARREDEEALREEERRKREKEKWKKERGKR